MARYLHPFELHRPDSLLSAVNALAQGNGVYVMGGCSLVPDMLAGRTRPERLVFLGDVAGLDRFDAHPHTGMHVGAAVPAGRLLPDIWTGKRYAAIHEAVEQMLPPHIANQGTFIGNLCAAKPEYDLPVAAMAMQARLCVTGPQGQREVPLDQFYKAPGQTVLSDGDVVTSMFVPPPGTDAGSSFKKLDRLVTQDGEMPKITAAATITYTAQRDKIIGATIVLGGWGGDASAFCSKRSAVGWEI